MFPVGFSIRFQIVDYIIQKCQENLMLMGLISNFMSGYI